MAEPDDMREPDSVPPAPVEPAAAPPAPRAAASWPGLIGGLLGGAVVAGGGGWYAYEHGPVKPALDGSTPPKPPRPQDAESGAGDARAASWTS